MLEWEVSAFLLSVHSCIPDMCRGLCCCHTSRLALGQHRVQFIFRVASEGEEMCSAWGCAIGAMGDGPACQGSRSRILLLDVSSSPPGSLASVRHNRALMQSSDFVGVLFNPRFRSLMNLFSITSPQLNTVPFIIIICLQSCSQLSIPVLCLPLPKSF